MKCCELLFDFFFAFFPSFLKSLFQNNRPISACEAEPRIVAGNLRRMLSLLIALLCACSASHAAARGVRAGSPLEARAGGAETAPAATRAGAALALPVKCVPDKNLLELGAKDKLPTALLTDWIAAYAAAAKQVKTVRGGKTVGCVLFTWPELAKFLDAAVAAQNDLVKQTWEIEEKYTDVAFAAKVALPADTEVSIFGDIHGNLQAFLPELQAVSANKHLDERLRVKGNGAIIFCGDLLDRGDFSIETFALALLLRMANPARVFIARGHHESGHSTSLWENYGVRHELEAKFHSYDYHFYHTSSSSSWTYSYYFKVLNSAAATLPLAIFFSVATDVAPARWALASHGAFEPSGSVKDFLAAPFPAGKAAVYAAFGAPGGPGRWLRATWNKNVHTPNFELAQGPDITALYRWADETDKDPQYQWGDIADATDSTKYWDDVACTSTGRCTLGRLLVAEWLFANNVVTLFRGHQHLGDTLKEVNRCVQCSCARGAWQARAPPCERACMHSLTRASNLNCPRFALPRLQRPWRRHPLARRWHGYDHY